MKSERKEVAREGGLLLFKVSAVAVSCCNLLGRMRGAEKALAGLWDVEGAPEAVPAGSALPVGSRSRAYT